MRHTTTLFWTCHCESHPFHRAHEERCVHCGDVRDEQKNADSNIAELLQLHCEYLTPDEISAFERALNPVQNELWELIVSDGTIDIREISRSMLDIEEAYVRRAEELGARWEEESKDYDWSAMDETCAVYGINTTKAEVIGYE